MPKAPINRCPYCGSEKGFLSKDYICGPSWVNYNFDGSEADNDEMYDTTKVTIGKYAYCCNCGKRLFKMSEITD